MGLRAGSVGGSRAFERSAYHRCRRRCRPMNSERGAVPPAAQTTAPELSETARSRRSSRADAPMDEDSKAN